MEEFKSGPQIEGINNIKVKNFDIATPIDID